MRDTPYGEKSGAEDIKKLEAEMRKKMEEMGAALRELQEKTPSVEGIAIEGIESKLQAVKEMQMEMLQKKEGLETALREIQGVVQSFKELRDKEKEKKEDVRPAIAALREKMKEKKESLQKAIKEMENLKDKYTKKFYGRQPK